MSDILEIKRMLADQAQEICEYVCPGGKRKGHEWVYDPGHGKIKVELRGTKAGVWSHFGGDGGGDLIDLWKEMRGLSMRDTLKEIKDYLGIEDEEPKQTARKQYNRPVPPRTDLTPEVDDKDVRLVKVRDLDGKSMPTEANCEPILFGWHTVPDDCREIVICEGELDAPSAKALGVPMPVLSVPFGGGGGQKQQWVENDWSRLEQMERIYLALDNDKEGDIGSEEIAKRVGRHKCLRVRLEAKDFNACLMEGMTSDAIKGSFENAEEMKPGGIRLVASYEDAVQDLFDPPQGVHLGYSVPFEKLQGGKLLFRPGEITLWSGDTGSGKSQVLGHCASYWVGHGSNVVLCSLEMAAKQSLRRMVRQCTDMNSPSREYVTECLRWLGGNDSGGRLLIYDQVGKDTIANILDAFGYCMRKYGADQFIIDSLMRLGIAADDYNGQEQAMYELTDWAVNHDAHIHLVAHNRKRPAGTHQQQGTDGVKGAMEVAANAFNHIEIWRRRDIEEALQAEENGFPLTDKQLDKLDRPPVGMAVNKQRNGDFEGRIGLWFDQATYRYREVKDPYGIGNNPYF